MGAETVLTFMVSMSVCSCSSNGEGSLALFSDNARRDLTCSSSTDMIIRLSSYSLVLETREGGEQRGREGGREENRKGEEQGGREGGGRENREGGGQGGRKDREGGRENREGGRENREGGRTGREGGSENREGEGSEG